MYKGKLSPDLMGGQNLVWLDCVNIFTKQYLPSGDPAEKSAVAQQDRGVETMAVFVHGHGVGLGLWDVRNHICQQILQQGTEWQPDVTQDE